MRPTLFSIGIKTLFACTAMFVVIDQAQAGSCPKDQLLAKPRQIEDKAEAGLKRETLSLVKLEGWRGVGDLLLRTRRLTLAKDGVVPTHYHNDRPSIVYIVKGEIIEHSTFCATPVVHRAGEWTPEFGDLHGHWWENKSGAEVVLLSSDVIPPDMQDDPNM